MFPDLARESKELPDDIGKPKAKEESRKSSQPKDALDGDIIINEVRHFVNSGGFRMFVGGILVYFVISYLLNTVQ